MEGENKRLEVWFLDPYADTETVRRFATLTEAEAWICAMAVPLLERRWRELSPMERRDAQEVYFDEEGHVAPGIRESASDLSDLAGVFWRGDADDLFLEWQIKHVDP